MSSLPLRFLASWQAKQFSLRMGATSLMKETGPLWAGGAAAAGGGASRKKASARARQRMQKQRCERNMVRELRGTSWRVVGDVIVGAGQSGRQAAQAGPGGMVGL